MKKEWLLKNNDGFRGSLIEKLLMSRGISSSEDIENFLNPLNMELTSPDVFTDMAFSEMAKIFEKEGCTIYTMEEHDESLEAFYLALLGGEENA